MPKLKFVCKVREFLKDFQITGLKIICVFFVPIYSFIITGIFLKYIWGVENEIIDIANNFALIIYLLNWILIFSVFYFLIYRLSKKRYKKLKYFSLGFLGLIYSISRYYFEQAFIAFSVLTWIDIFEISKWFFAYSLLVFVSISFSKFLRLRSK